MHAKPLRWAVGRLVYKSRFTEMLVAAAGLRANRVSDDRIRPERATAWGPEKVRFLVSKVRVAGFSFCRRQ
jgi:hypothetical protein